MSYLPVKSALRSNFRLSTLALSVSLALLSSHGFALEALDDASLADSTGEGLAFLPENFSMQFNGANNSAGNGSIRLIPVGPLTTASQDSNKDGVVNTTDHSVGKADIYLYGLALSQSSADYGVARNVGSNTGTNSRFDRTVTSWGSAINPWVFKVATQKDVPDFSASSPDSTTKGDVSYIMLEAPLYSTDVSALTPTEKSAYNLKLGLWADAFVRDPLKAEGDTAQFNLGENYGGVSDASRANRLRLQAIWDGFSLNGSNLKMFQTLGGVTATEVTQGLSKTYNNTLGISAVMRLNGGDGQNLRASYTDPNNTSGPMISSGNNAIRTLGAWQLSDVNTYGCGDASTNYTSLACEYRFQSRTVEDKFTSSSTWKAPSASSVLRLSTREAAGASNDQMLKTPAIDGVMPNFDSNEGIYLYNPNINLVLGSTYQPLTIGSDGQNITLEIARIPNKESIYKQVYTAYAGATGNLTSAQIAEYKGSTCNIYQCGTNTITGYQGSNATHSSITIGSTVYNAGSNTLEAHKGLSAVGISFGILQDNTLAAGTETKSYTQWQDQQRQARTRFFNWSDAYEVARDGLGDSADEYDPYTGAQDCSGLGGCNRTAQNNDTTQTLGSKSIFVSKGYHRDWIYRTTGNADNPGFFNPSADAENTANGAYTNPEIALCTGNGNTKCDTSTTARDYTNIGAKAANLSWTTRTGATANQPNWMDSTNTSALIRGVTLDNIPAVATINTSPKNNFGSAVIDGLLIQHMKITTKGL